MERVTAWRASDGALFEERRDCAEHEFMAWAGERFGESNARMMLGQREDLIRALTEIGNDEYQASNADSSPCATVGPLPSAEVDRCKNLAAELLTNDDGGLHVRLGRFLMPSDTPPQTWFAVIRSVSCVQFADDSGESIVGTCKAFEPIARGETPLDYAWLHDEATGAVTWERVAGGLPRRRRRGRFYIPSDARVTETVGTLMATVSGARWIEPGVYEGECPQFSWVHDDDDDVPWYGWTIGEQGVTFVRLPRRVEAN